ncbi:DUF6257 family protein [Streptomyces sp. HGB0020]|jgi:hypothetical protein|uniref:DUF6257 family protein n=1 Tax=Streptomyces sp. HGB0020 TaxID=1078086 RepID=UPI00034E9F43|nr:DUF6257 family protein [Streptomyces sp. HGB0020]EPD56370.1 hypothetical protein HMPREF1211_07490 [Streptomyces sp. HGB0020]
MADDLSWSDFTGGEKAHLIALHARMAKRGIAGPAVDLSDLQRKVRRIESRAERRKKSSKKK